MSVSGGDILKVVATMVWPDADIAQCVFHAVIAANGGPYDDDDIVDDAVDWVDTMFTEVETYVHQDLDGSQVQVYKYDSVDEDWDEVGTGTWTWSGTNAGSYLPRGVAALINAKSVDPDVSGRKFLPGFSESASEDGVWAAGVITALIAFAAEWIAGFTGIGSAASWQPVVWSTVGVVGKLFSGDVNAPTIPAYQRRRKQGVGV